MYNIGVFIFSMFVSAETLKDLKGFNLLIELEKHPIDNTIRYEYWMAVEDGEIVFKTNIPVALWCREEEDKENPRPLQNAIARTFNYDPKATFMKVGVEPQTQNLAFQFFPRQDAHASHH